jgi:hypothetical protein
MSIQYLPEGLPIKDAPLWWQKQGLQQTTTGYGAKLTSSKMVFFRGKWRRIYITCYGNAGSAWIETRGERFYLRDTAGETT